MYTKEILLKRLSTIKLLYKAGISQSHQNESTAFFSILMFHDSIEMFLTLAAEHNNIKADKFTFLEYWKHLTLTQQGPMNALNNRRVALKHKGIVPAKGEIEASRVNTTDFFFENTKPIFGFEFSEVSLYELIQFPQAKKLLIAADQFLQKQDFDNCIENVTPSFYELLREYKETKDYYGGDRTHFDFAEDTTFNNRFIDEELNPEVAEQLTKTFDKINHNFERVEQALAMVSLGIDYRKYTKFKILTPSVLGWEMGSMSSK